MAETTLDEQLNALKSKSFASLKAWTQVHEGKKEQEEFLSGYELEDMEKLQEALSQEMHDPSCFKVALQEMPRRLVTLLVMLVKIDNFELAHKAVCLILLREESNSSQRKKMGQILHQLLNQLLPQWDNIAIKNLDQELTTIIEKREFYDVAYNKTIEELFEANHWPGLEMLYTEHKESLLCEAHLNKIMLLAAWCWNWSGFMECLELGANFTETVDIVREQTVMNKVKYSILHEAVKNGLDLQQLELAGGFPEEMVNALDCRGNTLLLWTILIRRGSMKNILFLMKHKADVNIVNKSGMTAIQKLVGRGYVDNSAIDIMVAILERADKIEPHSWAPVEEWSVLCWLCVCGKYQHLLTAVEKGADVKHLHFKLTLIDMVILRETLSYDLKKRTLAVLLNKPINLGAFHASVVAQRPLRKENTVYRDKIGDGFSFRAGKFYLYPVMRLLFPSVHSRGFQRKHVNLVKMLVKGDAVCDAELLALKPYIQKLKDEDMHEAVECLLPLIEALSPSATASPQ